MDTDSQSPTPKEVHSFTEKTASKTNRSKGEILLDLVGKENEREIWIQKRRQQQTRIKQVMKHLERTEISRIQLLHGEIAKLTQLMDEGTGDED